VLRKILLKLTGVSRWATPNLAVQTIAKKVVTIALKKFNWTWEMGKYNIMAKRDEHYGSAYPKKYPGSTIPLVS